MRTGSRLRHLMAAVAMLLALGTGLAQAYSSEEQDHNHPEEKWFTAETQHFRFHYRMGLREPAEACASRAEAVYQELVDFYGVKPGRIDFVVQDEDYSNGWAIASLSTMSIWSADLGFAFRGSKDWIRDVVAHEFSHIASIQASSKAWPWLSELQVGWSDATGSRITTGGWGMWSLNPYSMAMAEGTAQWSSARLGGDRWDTHRQMIERTNALADSLLPWERMSVFSGSGYDFERVYNQGFSLVRFIERTRGAQAVPQWWQRLGTLWPQEWGGAWKALDGIGGDSLWKEWKDSTVADARRQREAVGPPVEGRVLFKDGYNTGHPRWRDSSTIFFSANPGADEGNNLWAYDLNDTAKDTSHHSWMVAGAVRGRFSIDTAARKVYYVSGRKTDDQGRHVLDAWSTGLKPEEGREKAPQPKDHQRITKLWHMAQLDAQSGRDSLVAVLREGMRFRVVSFPSDGLELPSGFSRQIFPAGDTGVVGTIFSVRWIAAREAWLLDWFDGKRRRCDLWGRDGKGRRLGDTASEWRDASMSPDGNAVYLSSDRTGIFNVYRQDLASDSLLQVTNVVGGAFEPELSPDGKRLAYVGFGVGGFQLCLLDSIRPFAPRGPLPVRVAVDAPQEQTWDLASREQEYSAIPNRFLVTPLAYFQKSAPFLYAGESQWSAMAGGRLQMLDPIRRNGLFGMLLLDLTRGVDFVGPGQPGFVNPRQEKLAMLGFENRSLPPTLSLQGLYQTMHGQDTVSKESSDGRSKSLSEQDWSLHLMQVSGGARYSLTENQKLHANLSWTRYDFDFYDLPLRYTGYESWSPSVFWTYYDRSDASMGVQDDPRGLMLRTQWSMDNSDLMRSGSFSDVFEVSSSGAITAKSTHWQVQHATMEFRWATGNPLFESQTLELSGNFASVLGWSGPADTLNDFFYTSFDLPGYPSMRGRERRVFQGKHAWWGGLATRFPLWRIDRGAWIWYGDRLMANAGVRAGRAWNGPLDQALDTAGLGVSLEWGLSLSGRLHASAPLSLSLGFARALRHLPGIVQPDLTLPIGGLDIPLGAQRLSFGLNLGFNEWSIVDQPMRRTGNLPHPSGVR